MNVFISTCCIKNKYLSKIYNLFYRNNIKNVELSVGYYQKAEIFLKRAVELMPDDPIVNDHYGDILWKLDRKIQARYFWTSVLKMKNVDEQLINKISDKLIEGPQSS